METNLIQKGAHTPIFGPFVVAKWLDWSICHLA